MTSWWSVLAHRTAGGTPPITEGSDQWDNGGSETRKNNWRYYWATREGAFRSSWQTVRYFLNYVEGICEAMELLKFCCGGWVPQSQIINAPKQDARKHNLQGNVKRKMRSCQPLVFVGSADSTSHGWSPHWLNLWIESAICTFLIRNSSIYGVWYLQEVSEPIPCRYQATIVYIYFSWIYWLAIND